MPVRIRLRRQGAHKQPTYRVVVADAQSPRDGRFIDIIGHYNPRTNPTTIVINEQKAMQWLSRGAQPTEVVARLMQKVGITERFEAAKKNPNATGTQTSEATGGAQVFEIATPVPDDTEITTQPE